MERRILSERPVSYHEARAEFEVRVKEGNLSDRLTEAWEYLKKFGFMDPEKARSFYEELVKILEEGLIIEEDKRYAKLVAANIVSICPKTLVEIREFAHQAEFNRVIGEIGKLERALKVARKYCGDQEVS